MERLEVEAFTPVHNYAVIRLPGRAFPGVVVQGDSLHVLSESVQEALDEVPSGAFDDAAESLRILLAHLHDLQRSYEVALHEHGVELPYRRA